MNISEVLAEKKAKSNTIKETYGLLKKYKPVGLIKLTDEKLSKELIAGLNVLGGAFVVVHENLQDELINKNVSTTSHINDDLIGGFDFVVSDDNIGALNQYASSGVAPIMIKENHLSNILQEFNPLKNEGNSFFYEELNSWSIFYTVVRYLENYKFPFDNKNLIKNILSI